MPKNTPASPSVSQPASHGVPSQERSAGVCVVCVTTKTNCDNGRVRQSFFHLVDTSKREAGLAALAGRGTDQPGSCASCHETAFRKRCPSPSPAYLLCVGWPRLPFLPKLIRAIFTAGPLIWSNACHSSPQPAAVWGGNHSTASSLAAPERSHVC